MNISNALYFDSLAGPVNSQLLTDYIYTLADKETQFQVVASQCLFFSCLSSPDSQLFHIKCDFLVQRND